mmetsp:Transcript_28954/g.33059  ORF Transcript_28954/g.33059 Transcript_28954/m.33059 type:complete len:217 (+) Transcript_28954:82-732(+)
MTSKPQLFYETNSSLYTSQSEITQMFEYSSSQKILENNPNLAMFNKTCSEQLMTFSLDMKCVMELFTSVVGYFLVILTMMNKIPQIIKIYKAKHAKGVLISMFYIDLYMNVNMILTYRHLGMTIGYYGELMMLAVQNVTLIFLIRRYHSTKSIWTSLRDFSFVASYFLFFTFCPNIPEWIWTVQISSVALLNFSSKAPQILLNFRNKSTGQLSFQM